MDNLNYFVGKVCSIFTCQINRNFKEENPKTYPQPLFVYFLGLIESVDEQGILVRQAATGLKSYFFLNHIVSIAEEEVKAVEPPVETAKDYISTDEILDIAEKIT